MGDVPSYKPSANGKSNAPGAPENKKLPTIEVKFDPATQQIGIVFKVEEFKTWDFIVAVLEAAKQQAIVSGQMARMMAMQQQAMRQEIAQQQGNAVAQQVHKNILRG